MIVCPKCGRQVIPVKKFSWAWFLLGFCFPYLVYHAFLKQPKSCPYCRCTNVFKQSRKQKKALKQQTCGCPVCGAVIAIGSNPCPNCGTGLSWH